MDNLSYFELSQTKEVHEGSHRPELKEKRDNGKIFQLIDVMGIL